MSEIEQLIEAIELHTSRTEDWNDGNYLADKLLTLASLYSSLGHHIADAERAADQAEIAFKIQRERAKEKRIKIGKEAIKSAEGTAIIDVQDEYQHFIKLKYNARLLFLTRQSLDKTMDSIRSALTQMRHDKEGSRHGI